MRKVCDAVYENGVFKPISLPSEITDGQYVRLTFEPKEKPGAEDVVGLFAKVFEGMTTAEIDEIEKVVLDRRDFFGRPPPEL